MREKTKQERFVVNSVLADRLPPGKMLDWMFTKEERTGRDKLPAREVADFYRLAHIWLANNPEAWRLFTSLHGWGGFYDEKDRAEKEP